MDTLRGLQKARECNFFSFDRFPIEEYEYYEKVENGDLNWIVEGKFAAFAGPHAASTVESTTGYQHLTPEHYVPYFQHRNVSLVIRLNKKYYDSRSFSNYGIDHMELYFLDGSNPPDHILDTFLRRCEETSGAVAVHCKAGLGRTGSCIGCYMMKHHRFTAEEAIGWMRIARPGCVIGPQQQWLKSMEQRMWHEGEIFRARQVPLTALSLSLKYPEATETDEESSVRGKGTPAVIHSARSSGKIRHTSSDDAVLSLSSKMAILGIGRDTDLLADGITINSARTSRKERTGSTPRTARGTAGNEKPPLSARARSETTLSGLHRENSVRSTSGTPRTARGSNTATGSTNTGGTTSRTPRTARSRAQSLATQSLNTSLISDAEEGEAATQGDFLVARRMHHQQNAQASIPEFEAKPKRSEDNGNNSLSLNLSAVSNSSLSAPNRSQLPKKSGTPRSAANPPSVIPSAGFSMATRSSKSGNSIPVASGTPISAAAGTAGAGQSPVYSPEEYEGANANSSTSKSKSRFRKFLSSTFKM